MLDTYALTSEQKSLRKEWLIFSILFLVIMPILNIVFCAKNGQLNDIVTEQNHFLIISIVALSSLLGFFIPYR